MNIDAFMAEWVERMLACDAASHPWDFTAQASLKRYQRLRRNQELTDFAAKAGDNIIPFVRREP